MVTSTPCALFRRRGTPFKTLDFLLPLHGAHGWQRRRWIPSSKNISHLLQCFGHPETDSFTHWLGGRICPTVRRWIDISISERCRSSCSVLPAWEGVDNVDFFPERDAPALHTGLVSHVRTVATAPKWKVYLLNLTMICTCIRSELKMVLVLWVDVYFLLNDFMIQLWIMRLLNSWDLTRRSVRNCLLYFFFLLFLHVLPFDWDLVKS